MEGGYPQKPEFRIQKTEDNILYSDFWILYSAF